jgi:hypothetical protein
MKHISLFMAAILLSVAVFAGGPVPTTQIKTGYCGRTDFIRNSELWADAVTGATQYEFQISDASDVTIIASRLQTSAKLILSQVSPALQWNTQYNVRVRAIIGADVGSYGTPCLIGIIENPTVTMPTTSLTTTSCNATGLSLSNYIYAQQVPGATHYRFEFTNTGSGVVTTREVSSYFLKLNNTIPILSNPGNYDVRVLVRFSTYYTGVYTTTCPISIGPGPASIPTTQLTSTYCGTTGLWLTNAIQATGVSAATQYEFEFRTPLTNSLIAVKLSNTRTIALNSVSPALQWNSQYNVRVRAYKGTAVGPYGGVCSISLAPDPSIVVPSTSLNSASCGAIDLTPFSTINAAPVSGATQYLFTFSLSGVPYATITTTTTACNMSNVIPGIAWNTTYSVTVQANVGGTFGSPGLPCNITTVQDPLITGVPDTRLNNASCNNLSLTITSVIGATGVFGATLYDFHIFDPANPGVTYAEVNQISNSLPIVNISPALQTNVTYNVVVRAKIGNIFGNFSTSCDIKVVGSSPARIETGIEDEMTENNAGNLIATNEVVGFTIYPNPTQGEFKIQAEDNAEFPLTICILDNTGKVIKQSRYFQNDVIELDEDLAFGLYYVQITDRNAGNTYHKLLKR